MTKKQKDGISLLKLAVYPPPALPQRFRLGLLRRLGRSPWLRDRLKALPGKKYIWESPQWSILIMEDDVITGRVGMLVRSILSNQTKKEIGGVCGVMTHPSKRGKGLASRAMREAAHRFYHELEVSYALLFCRPTLVPFYERLRWRPFTGQVLVNQPEGQIDFSAKGAMVLDVREPAPSHGVLNLNGLPW